MFLDPDINLTWSTLDLIGSNLASAVSCSIKHSLSISNAEPKSGTPKYGFKSLKKLSIPSLSVSNLFDYDAILGTSR